MEALDQGIDRLVLLTLEHESAPSATLKSSKKEGILMYAKNVFLLMKREVLIALIKGNLQEVSLKAELDAMQVRAAGGQPSVYHQGLCNSSRQPGSANEMFLICQGVWRYCHDADNSFAGHADSFRTPRPS